jgi:hypothetical protein
MQRSPQREFPCSFTKPRCAPLRLEIAESSSAYAGCRMSIPEYLIVMRAVQVRKRSQRHGTSVRSLWQILIYSVRAYVVVADAFQPGRSMLSSVWPIIFLQAHHLNEVRSSASTTIPIQHHLLRSLGCGVSGSSPTSAFFTEPPQVLYIRVEDVCLRIR